MTTAEALADMEERLPDADWAFTNWCRCTCGQAYAAVHGVHALTSEAVYAASAEDEAFVATLRALALAGRDILGRDVPERAYLRSTGLPLAILVSDYTKAISAHKNVPSRTAALMMVRAAREAIEPEPELADEVLATA